MRIGHIAIWTYNLEGLRNFYTRYFDASSSDIYYNHSKEFSSYFLKFKGDCCLEIMSIPNLAGSCDNPRKNYPGLAHFAMQVGSKDKVDRLTKIIKEEGFKVISEPRTTGSGCYESVILDPEGNKVEIIWCNK